MSPSRAVDGNEPKKGLYVHVGASAEHRHTSLHKVLAKVEEKRGEDPNKARGMAAQYMLINKKRQPLAEVIGRSQTLYRLTNCDTLKNVWITPDDISAGKLV